MPSIHLIKGASKSVFDFVLITRFYRAGPEFDALIEIVAMYYRLPAAAFSFRQRHAGIIEPPLIEVIEPAIRIGGPENLRHSVGQLAKAIFRGIQTGVRRSFVPHVALATAERNDEKQVRKDHPGRILDRSPTARGQNSVDRLRPKQSAQKVISGYH